MARIPVPMIDQQVGVSGPLGTPDARGGQLADYAGQVDQGLGKLAQQQSYYAELRENDQANAWAANAASDFKLKQYQNFKQGQDTAQPGADGFTKSYLEGYDKDSQDLIATAPTPRAKKYLTNHLDQFRTTMGEQSLRFEAAEGYNYRETQQNQATQNSASLVYQNPDLYDQELQSRKDSAAAMQTHPSLRQKASDDATKALTDAYWASKAQSDPQGTANQLKATVPTQPGSIPDKIKTEAAAQGVDPHVALAIASVETGGKFNPDAKNPNSSATGVYQTIDSTWAGLGGTPENRGDPDAQVQLGVKNLAQNQKILQQVLKRDPTPGEQYMAQLMGPATAAGVLKAPDNTPVHDVFLNTFKNTLSKDPSGDADAATNNNGMAGMTVGQARQHWDAIIGAHMQKTQGLADAPAPGEAPAPTDNPAINNLSLPDRLKFLSHAETIARKDDSDEKAALTARYRDSVATYRQGNDAPNPPTYPELAKAHGPQVAAQIQSDLLGWKQYAFDVGSIKTMPFDQQQQLLKARIPAPGTGAAEGGQRLQDLQKAVNDVNQQRLADPAKYALGVGSLQPLDFSNADFLSGPMSARFVKAGQIAQDYSTPYKAFSEPEAQAFGQFIATAPPAQTQAYLAQLHNSADTPEHYRAAIAQIAPNQPVIAVAGLVADKQQPGQADAAALMLKGNAILAPSKAEKSESGKTAILMPENEGEKGFEQAWQKAVGGAYGGNSQAFNQDFQAARAYYIGAQDPGARSKTLDPKIFQAAVHAVTGGIVSYAGKATLPPYGMQPADFPDAVNAAWPQLMKDNGYDPEHYPAGSYTLNAIDDGKYTINQGTSVLQGKNGPVILDLSNTPKQSPQQVHQALLNKQVAHERGPLGAVPYMGFH